MERYLNVNIRVFAGFLMMFICREFKESFYKRTTSDNFSAKFLLKVLWSLLGDWLKALMGNSFQSGGILLDSSGQI